MLKVWDITETASLPAVAGEILAEIESVRVPGQATVVALHGDLGAGKTTFVQTVGQSLQVKEDITSPTFVVMKKYDIDKTGQKLIHIDAYRIESAEELSVLNLEEEISQPENIIFIEWAERVAELLPINTAHLKFSLTDNKRLLEYEHGSE
ncbi:MAG: tRNA (adenosine(37)-N6)-threonylcarbamoyltransferase complex ATPase subunit type 1 TsaE [Candidatus Paceibacterota bacterium]